MQMKYNPMKQKTDSKHITSTTLSLSIVLAVFVLLISLNSLLAWAQPIHIVSTRDHFDKLGNLNVNNIFYNPFDFEGFGCPNEAVVYVHGVWTARDRASEDNERMFENAIEISD